MSILKKVIFSTLGLVVGVTAFGTTVHAQPHIKILATGGTIAGKSASNEDVKDYKAGSLGVESLIAAVPEMQKYAQVSGEQICNINSSSITSAIWLKLAKRCNELLAQADVQGIVITHGTDTLEETAYFLNLVVKSKKPVVIVGAMRPATAISADGPMNLLEAVRVAASKEAMNKGVLVVMNDDINGARDVTKSSTTNVATFKSPELGRLGYVQGEKILFYNTSTRRHTANSEFDITNLTALPRVDIVYSHVNDDRVMVDAAVNAGAQGIIHAGTGQGSVHDDTLPGLIDAAKQGVVVVRSTRVANGYVDTETKYEPYNFVYADTLNPQKARILLSLALTKTKNPQEIQRMFNEY